MYTKTIIAIAHHPVNIYKSITYTEMVISTLSRVNYFSVDLFVSIVFESMKLNHEVESLL